MENRSSSPVMGSVDYQSIFRDILKNWVSILLVALSAGMLTHVIMTVRYTPVYMTKTTMVVTRPGSDTNSYTDLYSAGETAARFTQILNTNILQKKVAEEIGLPYFHGTAEAANLQRSNLLVLTVRAESPSVAFREMRAILDNYEIVAGQMMENVNLTILEAAEVPSAPEKPLSTGGNVLRVFLLALLLMALLVGIQSAMRDTIRSSRDVEAKLDARRLGTIYHERKRRSLRAVLRGRKKSILITDPVVSFRYVEAIRKLASRVTSLMEERGAKTVLVSSVLENEGKSTVAANMALAMVQEGKRTLLVDADFRKPAQYRILGMDGKDFESLTDALRGEIDLGRLILKVPGTELMTILNRNALSQADELISSGRMRMIIESCRKYVDAVIVDTSPMQLVADAEELASCVDCCILCVRHHLVEARDINDAIDALSGRERKLIGVVLNNVPGPGIGSTQSANYSYGESYGS